MVVNKQNKFYVPMGSIGTGCLGIDHRGRLYNDIQSAICKGPLMPNSFAVVRSSFGQGASYMRALCTGMEGEGESLNETAPPYLKKEDYKQQLSYPLLSSHLTDDNVPLKVAWSFFSPLAPYDHVASVMPCMLLSVRVANPNNRPVICSVMFCVDNLATDLSDDGNITPAQIHFIRVEPSMNDNRSHLGTSLFRGSIAEAQPDLLKSYVRNALLFGDRRNTTDTARPHFCLSAREQLDSVISRGIWDPESPESYEYFWNVFQTKGVAAPPKPGTTTRAGAICGATKLGAGVSYRFDFLYSWHLPPAVCAEKGVANGYMQHFPNAPETIRYGLRHLDYLHKAVSNWQKRLIDSGLPEEFSRALIDSTRAFVTYSRHLEKNGFLLLSNVDGDGNDIGAWDFLRAFSLLSFAPRFHAAAVTTAIKAAEADAKNATQLKDTTFQKRCAELVLSAYADILYTGNRARFRDWYPRIGAILDSGMQALLEKQTTPEVVPSVESTVRIGLWAAAMNAIVLMGHEQNDSKGVEKREPLRRALSVVYEKQLATQAASARGAGSVAASPVATLAGACYGELLNLSVVSSHDAIIKLLPQNMEHFIAATETDETAQHNRFIAAIARILFNRRPIDQQAGVMKPLLSKLAAPAVSGDTARAVLPNRLGLWAVLQSLAGVYYDSLHHAMIIRPSAISELKTTLPIFTPVSLGKMDVQIEKGQEQIMIIRIAFETPLTVESIALRLPVAMRAVRASCMQGEETVTSSQELLPGDSSETNIALRFRTPLKFASLLTLRLRETTPQRF